LWSNERFSIMSTTICLRLSSPVGITRILLLDERWIARESFVNTERARHATCPLTTKTYSTAYALSTSAAKSRGSCFGMDEFMPYPKPSRAGSAGQTRASVPTQALRAATRAAATHASVAAPISGHDAAAEAAGWGIAQVHDFAQGVGGVHRTTGGRGRAPYTFG